MDLQLLIEACPDMDLNWIISGRESTGVDYVHLPLYDLDVAAGAGAEIGREEVRSTLAFRRDWLSRHGLNSASLALVSVSGESMAPTLQHGDVILVDLSQREVRSNQVYVIRVGSEGMVKRLRRTDGYCDILSDNPVIPPAQRPLSEVHVIGRVVWFGRKVI